LLLLLHAAIVVIVVEIADSVGGEMIMLQSQQ
jgi:hypothetical protein